MQYQGGKARPGKHIATILAKGLAAGTGNYIEPFMGACGVARHVAPHAVSMTLSDASEDLVLMWRAVRDGWEPPREMSRERYAELRHAPPSPDRAFAGFAMSYAAKWFRGYAEYSPQKRLTQPNSYCEASANVILQKVADLSRCPRVSINMNDYRHARPKVGDVVYCDPPYAGTERYNHVAFDHATFWDTMREWDDKHVFVFVSEFTAPAGWVRVWGKPRDASMRGGEESKNKIDGLYCTPTTAQILGLSIQA